MTTSIRKNYLYSVIYRISICILPLAVTPYAARVLGVENNGLYAFSSTIACYFIMFGKLGLDNYGNRSIAFCRDDIEARSRTFWGIYLMQAGTCFVSMLVYVGVVWIFFPTQALLYGMQFLYVLSALFDVSWFFYGMEQFRITTIRSVLSRALLVAGVYLFVSSERDLWIFTGIMSASFLLEQLMLFPFVFRYVRPVRLHPADILRHIRPNLRLFVPLLALSVYNWMDKILLGLMDGTDSVAFFSYAENIINLPKGIVLALGTVMLPKLSYLAANRRLDACRQILRGSMRFVGFLGCALCFGIAGAAPVFVPWFLSPAYSPTVWLTIELAVVMLPMSIADVVQTQYLIPFRREYIYLQSVSLGAGVNLLLNLLLIRPLGASGSVIGTLGAETVVCLYQMLRIRQVYPLRQLGKTLTPFLLCGLVEFAAVYGMGGLPLPPVPLLLLQMTAGCAVYLLCCFVYFRAAGGGSVREAIRSVGIFGENRRDGEGKT